MTLSRSIPHFQFSALLVATAVLFAVIWAPTFAGCLIQQPAVVAAEPQPVKADDTNTLRLTSPNGVYTVLLQAQDTGCRLILTDTKTNRTTSHALTEDRAVLNLNGGPCKYGAVSSKDYAGSSVLNADVERLTTMFVNIDDAGTMSGVACYDGVTGNPDAAIYADAGVGTIRLQRDNEAFTIQPPKQQIGPDGNKDDGRLPDQKRKNLEAIRFEPDDPLAYLD